MGAHNSYGNTGKFLGWVIPNLLLGVSLHAACSSTTRSQGVQGDSGGQAGANETGMTDTGGVGGTLSLTSTSSGTATVGTTEGTNSVSSGGTVSVTSTTGNAGTGGEPPTGDCVEGTTRSCATAPFNRVGACAADTAVCEDGEWVGCPESLGDDTCEPGNDNDCNGTP